MLSYHINRYFSLYFFQTFFLLSLLSWFIDCLQSIHLEDRSISECPMGSVAAYNIQVLDQWGVWSLDFPALLASAFFIVTAFHLWSTNFLINNFYLAPYQDHPLTSYPFSFINLFWTLSSSASPIRSIKLARVLSFPLLLLLSSMFFLGFHLRLLHFHHCCFNTLFWALFNSTLVEQSEDLDSLFSYSPPSGSV